jgi:hypothetical protein
LAETGIQIAPSTYHARRSAPVSDGELEQAYLANRHRSLHHDNWWVYGVRKLWRAARRARLETGRDRAAG